MPSLLAPVSSYILAAYNQPLVAKPVDICSTDKHKSKIVPVVFNWTTFPSFAVSFNLNQGTTGSTMDNIVGVYVDNAENGSELVLICPDTGYRVVVPPISQIFVPLFNRTNIVNVYNGEHINTLAPGANVTLQFTNFLVNEFSTTTFPAAIAEFQASSVLANSGTEIDENFGPPILGDLHVDNNFSLSVTGNQTLIAAPPKQSGLWVFKNLQFSIYNCYNTTGTGPLQLIIGLLTSLGAYVELTAYINHDDKYLPFTTLYDQQTGYLKVDPLLVSFFNVVAIPGGQCRVLADYAWVA